MAQLVKKYLQSTTSNQYSSTQQFRIRTTPIGSSYRNNIRINSKHRTRPRPRPPSPNSNSNSGYESEKDEDKDIYIYY